MVFEVIVLLKPTINEMNDGALPKIIFGPSCFVARDAQHAAMQVGLHKELSQYSEQDRSRFEFLIRNF